MSAPSRPASTLASTPIAARVASVVALSLATFLLSTSSLAQTREADAERLFREGQKLLEERRFGEACPKFEAAYKKDGQLGTLINLAFCHKEQGAIWYAWLEFREAEVKAVELVRPDRRDFARLRLAELQKQLPKVVIDTSSRLPLTEVLVEDRKVWEAERGAVFAAEPGDRKFTFRAKGKKQVIVLVNVTKGDRVQHVPAPEMEDLPPEDVAPPAVESPRKPESPPPPPSSGASPGTTQRTLGWVAIGVGGVGVVVGGVTGILTLSSSCANLRGTSKTCPTADKSSASTTAAMSTVSFMVAGVGVASGLVLLLTAPSASTSTSARRPPERASIELTPRIGPGFAGVEGSF